MKSKFAIRLKELRQERGFTQKEMAALMGTVPSTISRYERGSRAKPLMSTVSEFAKILDVSIDYLHGTSDIRDVDFSSEGIARIFRKLSIDKQNALMTFAKMLLKEEGK